MANTSNQRVPDSSYFTLYPYNQTYLTEGGHLLELDNTPGHERIRIGHKSGGYSETNSDGSHVEVHAGHNYSYGKGGATISVDHNMDTKAGGGARSSHAGDTYHETAGDKNTCHTGDKIDAVIGAVTNMVKGNKNDLTQGHHTTKTNGDSNHYTSGTTTLKGGGNFQVTSDGGTVTITAPGSSITMGAGGVVTIKASKIVLNGEVHLGADGGTLAVQATDLDTAGNAVPAPKSSRVFIGA